MCNIMFRCLLLELILRLCFADCNLAAANFSRHFYPANKIIELLIV